MTQIFHVSKCGLSLYDEISGSPRKNVICQENMQVTKIAYIGHPCQNFKHSFSFVRFINSNS